MPLFRRSSNKSNRSIEYVEFDDLNDAFMDNGESKKNRLNTIWREENRSKETEREITDHVQKQEYEPTNSNIDATGNNIHKNVQSHATRSLPTIMHEHVINTTNQFNKIFASTFVSEDVVTFGTKDNKLMLLDVAKGKICQIRLPNPEKSLDYKKKSDTASQADTSKSCGIHDLKFSSNTNTLVTGGYNPQDVAVFKYEDDVHHIGPKKFSHNLIPIANLKFHKDWVFAMDFIDDRHLVTGGKDGQLSIWDISSTERSYEHYREKHGLKLYNKSYGGGYTVSEFQDSPFADFVGFADESAQSSTLGKSRPELTQSLLGGNSDLGNDLMAAAVVKESLKQPSSKPVSVSQDRCNVPILRKPVHFTSNKKHRVRALKAFSKTSSVSHSQCVVSLAINGEVQIYDVNQQKTIFDEQLPHKKEAVCIDVNQDKGQILVGSQGHIQIFDPRASLSQSLFVVDSLDKNWGCRTLSCHTDLITVGGGLGRLSFYDLRKMEYLDCTMQNRKIKEVESALKYRTMEKGWIKEDDVYNNIFVMHSLPTPTAVYTHCYNPSRSKLFAAGGPTPYGLFGSAASVYY